MVNKRTINETSNVLWKLFTRLFFRSGQCSHHELRYSLCPVSTLLSNVVCQEEVSTNVNSAKSSFSNFYSKSHHQVGPISLQGRPTSFGPHDTSRICSRSPLQFRTRLGAGPSVPRSLSFSEDPRGLCLPGPHRPTPERVSYPDTPGDPPGTKGSPRQGYASATHATRVS